ncbi:MAG: ATP-dependent Clp protease ATP-binding subunit [Candidatus Eremiobacterota bacterium]
MGLRHSEECEELLVQAKKFARKNNFFGVEHVFLALIDKERSLVEDMISSSGITLDYILEEMNNYCWPTSEQPVWNEFITTPRMKNLLKIAEKEALTARSMKIEPVHYLQAILKEGRGVVPVTLINSGLNLDELYSNLSGEAPPEGRIPPIPSISKGENQKPDRGKKSLLARCSRDLVLLAKEGKLEPVIGRKDETVKMIQVLTRRGKNNPVIIGEPGVGKTALVMALAQRIAENKVPETLRGKKIMELSMTSLVAGTKHRGEFEERLEQLLKEVDDPNIILFIDELHIIIGAGDSKGSMDAANILKPALARGDITLIGATTIDEYRKYIEKDPALERRFQPVQVNEPSEADTIEILKALRPKFEEHHKVKISDEAVVQAVKLSVRYLTERFLPDKAIDIIDEACSSVKVQQYVSFMPGKLKYNEATGEVEEIESEKKSPPISDITEDVSCKGDRPVITEKEVAKVIALWTDIPIENLTTEESVRLAEMEERMKSRVKGQDKAIHKVSQVVKMARLGLANPGRPRGVFLFLGSTGVGKTELAKALAEFLFGSEDELIRLDMSEYKEKHSISKLIGAPAGYVGHEEEGRFTRMVRTKPYSVVLLDEVEKAHPEVFDIFLQVFDDGRLTDQRGRTINFCNTIIIMTSNLAVDYDEILKKVDEEKQMTDGWAIDEDMVEREKICDRLQEYFRPEFLNRIDEIVVFNPLIKEVLRNIADVNIASFLKRLKEEKSIDMEIDEELVELILKYGYNPRYGARPLKRAVQRFLINTFAQKMLEEEFKPGVKVYATVQGERVVFRKEGEISDIHDERNKDDRNDDEEDFLNKTWAPEK